MTDVRHAAGQRGEDLAAEHLERLGFEILARNHRTRFGELDLVAFDGDVLVFVEVKTRRSGCARAVGEPPRPQALAGPPDGDRVADRTARSAPTAPSCASTASPCCSTRAASSCGSTTSRRRSDARPGHDLRGRRGRCPARLGGGRHPPRAAGVHRRRARRQGGARGARTGARGDRQLGLRVPAAAHHGQPRARLPAQGRAGVRPAARGGAARRVLSAARRRRSRAARCSASSR